MPRHKQECMIKPSQVATIIIGAMLSACLLLLALDPAAAGPVAASSAAAAPPPPPLSRRPLPRMRAYLFRGALGPIFSRGMDHLAERDRKGRHPGECLRVHDLPPDRRECNSRVSRGSRPDHPDRAFHGRILRAEIFGNAAGRKYLGQPRCHDRSASDQPARAAQYRALYQYLPVERASSVAATSSRRKAIKVTLQASISRSMTKFRTSISTRRTTSTQQLVTKILQLATTPAKAAGEAVPLNYVVPPDAAIELWDSGMPVFARPGDTLQTIAALYHVPLWSLTQVNKGWRKAHRWCPASASSFRAIWCRSPRSRGRRRQALTERSGLDSMRSALAAGTGSALERGGSKGHRRRRRVPSSESLLPCGPSAKART